MTRIRPTSLTAVAAVAIALAAIHPARADITFELGNHPQDNEENVLFTSDQLGNPIFGITNQSDVNVKFSTTGNYNLFAPSSGQARVEARSLTNSSTQVALTDLTVSVPGMTFGDLIINPFVEKFTGGPATVSVLNNLGVTETFSYDLANGNNFLTILAVAGQSIQSVNITGTGISSFEFGDLRQPRISGPFNAAVPEPASFATTGLGVLMSLGYAWRRRKRAAV